MASVVINGDTSGQITLSAPTIAGTNTITLPASTGTALVAPSGTTITVPATTGTLVTTGDSATVTPTMLSQPLVRATAQATTSGTSFDFTGIPSWVKRITVMFNNVSTNGTSITLVQLGSSSGGVETTGYVSTRNGTNGVNGFGAGYTTGFAIGAGSAAEATSGLMIIANVSGNIWVESMTSSNTGAASTFGGGTKTLSATLDRIRITTVNGTDVFDSGSVNILYEG